MKKIFAFISLALCALAAMANTYTDKLTVTVNGESTEQQATINITQQDDGKYTLSLKNFVLESGDSRIGVGNIVLADREGTVKDGITTINYNDNLLITDGDDPDVGFWMGSKLGPVPIEMVARFNDTQLYCEIHINLMDMLGQMIDVVFGTEPEPTPDVPEEVSAPTIMLKEGVDNVITILVGSSNLESETCTTYYTTNGSLPSATNGTAISVDTDVQMTEFCTVKAITISSSGMESSVTSYNFAYVFPEEVSAPTISLKEGAENVVTISVGTTNHEDETATTYYTTDGTEPSATNGTAISEDTDVALTENCTVKAVTISTSGLQSGVVTFNFTYNAPEEVSAPAISLKEGVENVVTIKAGKTSRTSETATTYYTTDGSEPNATNGTAITTDTDVTLSENCTVKAVTISTSGMKSEVVAFDFTYIAPEEVSAPSITKKEGVKNTVTIKAGKTTRDSETATTYYTTDGSDPTATNGTAITTDTDVELTQDCTVKAITISTSGKQSEVVTFAFTYEQESGIDQMENEELKKDNSPIYDLQGRKIVNRQSVNRNSLYIVNGKKVAIR